MIKECNSSSQIELDLLEFEWHLGPAKVEPRFILSEFRLGSDGPKPDLTHNKSQSLSNLNELECFMLQVTNAYEVLKLERLAREGHGVFTGFHSTLPV